MPETSASQHWQEPVVPGKAPLQLPPGYFILQRGPKQYQALYEEAPSRYQGIAPVRTRRTTAAQDVYRHAAMQRQA
jgi:hypothetical protein